MKNVKTVEVKKNRTNERKVTTFAVEAISKQENAMRCNNRDDLL